MQMQKNLKVHNLKLLKKPGRHLVAHRLARQVEAQRLPARSVGPVARLRVLLARVPLVLGPLVDCC